MHIIEPQTSNQSFIDCNNVPVGRKISNHSFDFPTILKTTKYQNIIKPFTFDTLSKSNVKQNSSRLRYRRAVKELIITRTLRHRKKGVTDCTAEERPQKQSLDPTYIFRSTSYQYTYPTRTPKKISLRIAVVASNNKSNDNKKCNNTRSRLNPRTVCQILLTSSYSYSPTCVDPWCKMPVQQRTPPINSYLTAVPVAVMLQLFKTNERAYISTNQIALKKKAGNYPSWYFLDVTRLFFPCLLKQDHALKFHGKLASSKQKND